MELTHKERILAAVNHKPVDRIPTDMWATIEVQEKLMDHFGVEEGKGEADPCFGLNGSVLSRGVQGILALWDKMDIDGILFVRPPYIGPEYKVENEITYNEWGFGFRQSPYEYGTYEEQIVYPLSEIETLAEAEEYNWPDPDWYDYSALPGIISQCGGRAVCCGYSAAFTYHNYIRGMENSLMDPVLNPEIAQYIISRISDFFTEYHRRCFEAAGDMIDFNQVTDDWGSQNGLMTSPDIFYKFYREPMQRAIDLAKSYNIQIFHHDDGDMRMLIPELIDMGVDVLNPIQWRCGDWDLISIKKEYGKKLCFHSAVDNQETLPMGSPEDVKKQVMELIDTFAGDKTGFILGPCHNLQPNTSVENILTLYKTAHEYGRF